MKKWPLFDRKLPNIELHACGNRPGILMSTPRDALTNKEIERLSLRSGHTSAKFYANIKTFFMGSFGTLFIMFELRYTYTSGSYTRRKSWESCASRKARSAWLNWADLLHLPWVIMLLKSLRVKLYKNFNIGKTIL